MSQLSFSPNGNVGLPMAPHGRVRPPPSLLETINWFYPGFHDHGKEQP